jgi:hypothetical protein
MILPLVARAELYAEAWQKHSAVVIVVALLGAARADEGMVEYGARCASHAIHRLPLGLEGDEKEQEKGGRRDPDRTCDGAPDLDSAKYTGAPVARAAHKLVIGVIVEIAKGRQRSVIDGPFSLSTVHHASFPFYAAPSYLAVSFFFSVLG